MAKSSKSLKKAWTAYRNGDKLSDSQILQMIKQVKAGLEYMQDRLPEFYLPWKESNQDLNMLEAYAKARNLLNEISVDNESV